MNIVCLIFNMVIFDCNSNNRDKITVLLRSVPTGKPSRIVPRFNQEVPVRHKPRIQPYWRRRIRTFSYRSWLPCFPLWRYSWCACRSTCPVAPSSSPTPWASVSRQCRTMRKVWSIAVLRMMRLRKWYSFHLVLCPSFAKTIEKPSWSLFGVW